VTQLRKSSQPASELHQRSSKCPEGKRNEHPFSHRSNHRVRFWLVSAPDHFTKPDDMSQYAKAKRVPFPKVAVAGTGVLELLGGASMLLGAHPTIGIILLIVFMLGSTFPMHNFWTANGPQMKQADMIHFLKNMAIVGALLMLLAIPQPWPFSLASR
jgi:uncharacterized membrane protein YphA (DoxX/SURF4 family)